MGVYIKNNSFDQLLTELSRDYIITAPVKLPGKGAFSDTPLVTYREIRGAGEIEFNEKSRFSPKEIIYPITQTLFYFTENEYSRPAVPDQGIIIFCRACDVHAFRRLDEIFLRNGGCEDIYFAELRKKVKFFVMECRESFENCFCVSMGTNRLEDYDVMLRVSGDAQECDARGDFAGIFTGYGEAVEMIPRFVEENHTKVTVPENIDRQVFKHPLWEEYSSRCIACGHCTVSCPTCTCFTMQDIFYEDNPKCGERRRVWASCMIDGFTSMVGGHGFRNEKGDRMRFKVMHKIYDFRKRFGYNMCVGCGRCDDVCPEYISFANCINRVNTIASGVSAHE
ncbi:MAG: sulfite reductase subunit A [Peptococcaceae bacterium BRH_c4b]|nr:MAG: sulfite reductase subunit A [Peptococcaceae bacterium BRH_c4b]